MVPSARDPQLPESVRLKSDVRQTTAGGLTSASWTSQGRGRRGGRAAAWSHLRGRVSNRSRVPQSCPDPKARNVGVFFLFYEMDIHVRYFSFKSEFCLRI